MKDQIEARIAELQDEFQAGDKMLAELDARRAEVQQTLLRISGALEVLGELVGPKAAEDQVERERPGEELAG